MASTRPPAASAGELLLGHADDALATRVRSRLGRVDALLGVEPPAPVVRAGGAPAGHARSERRDEASTFARLATVDWDTLVRDHRRKPFADDVRAELVARDDCPRAAVLALVVVPSSATACSALGAALERRVVTLRQVALEGTPGWAAVRTLACWVPWPGDRRHAPVDRVLDEAAGLLPGHDPIAWRWLIDRAPGHPDTFGRLCMDASNASWAGDPQARRGSWSADPGGRRVEAVASRPRWTVLTPLGLLGRVAPPVAARVVAALPASLIREFLSAHEKLSARVVGPLLRTGVVRAEDLAGRLSTDPAQVREFLALRHSGVHAELLASGVDRRTRDAIFRATRRDAPRCVPLPTGWRHRSTVNPHGGCAEAVFGHHPELIRPALGLCKAELGIAGMLRGLLGIWEVRGRWALRDPRLLHRLGSDSAAARFARSVAFDPRGLERLRAEVARHERPDVLVAAMREAPALAARYPGAELWPAAVAAHDREPLPAATLANLAGHPDCPDELSLPACRSDPVLALRLADRSPRHALVALGHPMPHVRRTGTPVPWFVDVLADGLLAVRDVVEQANPAHRMLEGVDALAAILPDEAREARHVVAEHTRRTLGGEPDAWAVAVRLLPDFVAGLPELLATAAAAVFRTAAAGEDDPTG
ncbi:hypothetical protein [Embleya scabrispora]|uniref:hypothetical protein n=1 Tax=Embleya scabrispora TaxID=159449 RepID=UPI001319F1E2|nr:hypothetical protein [Embleya scabrispora]MYS83939.1 hypothetical protein [Streptomyces sp. SID5474]